MSKNDHAVSDVFDSIEALSQMHPRPFGDSAKDVLKSLADHLDKSYQNIFDYVKLRRYKSPNASTFIEMVAWRDKMLAKVERNKVEKAAYNKALREVKKVRAV